MAQRFSFLFFLKLWNNFKNHNLLVFIELPYSYISKGRNLPTFTTNNLLFSIRATTAVVPLLISSVTFFKRLTSSGNCFIASIVLKPYKEKWIIHYEKKFKFIFLFYTEMPFHVNLHKAEVWVFLSRLTNHL